MSNDPRNEENNHEMNAEEYLYRLRNGKKDRENAEKAKLNAQEDLERLRGGLRGEGRRNNSNIKRECEEFRKRYSVENDDRRDQGNRNFRGSYRAHTTIEKNGSRNNEQIRHEKYTAPKGTKEKLKNNLSKVKKRLGVKVASIVLGITLGLGAVSGMALKAHSDNIPEHTVTDLNNMGIELQLGEDTLDSMLEYDQYFENYDAKEANLSESEILKMANDIRELNFNVIKDKSADVLGLKRGNIDLIYDDTDKDNAKMYSAIKAKHELYTVTQGMAVSQKDEESISPDIGNLILQIGDLDRTIQDVQDDRISKNNAVKKLNYYYNNITKLATKEFTIDEKGNIKTEEYDNVKDIEAKEENKQDIERE